MGEACAVQSSDRRVGRVTGRYRGRKWSADVVGVFNTCADTDRHAATQTEHTLSSEMHTTLMQKAFFSTYYNTFICSAG